MTTKQAAKVFADEPYKKELIEGITDKTVSVYTQGNFSDMCRGPHLLSTGRVKAFKLTQIAGAYWRGDSKNKMLTRIYGTSFDKNPILTSTWPRWKTLKNATTTSSAENSDCL